MALTITINGDAVTTARLESLVLVDKADRGEVGTANLTIDDTAGTYVPPAMKAITITESACTYDDLLWRGYVAERTARRGPLRVASQRQWDVTCEDLNVLLDDQVVTGSDGGVRPAETDRERVLWLLGSTATPGIGSGSIVSDGADDTVDMDKESYVGETARTILDDCADANTLNFFVYDHGAGAKLFYNAPSATSLTAGLEIDDGQASDFEAETPVVAPASVEVPYDPSRVFSTVRLQYDGGVVVVTKEATQTNFRRREKNVVNRHIKTHAKALKRARKILSSCDSESRSFSMTLYLPAEHVNRVKAGMRVKVTSRVAGVSAEYLRVTQREVRPRSGPGGVTDVEYEVNLVFRDKVWVEHYWQRRDAPTSTLYALSSDSYGVAGATPETTSPAQFIIPSNLALADQQLAGSLTLQASTDYITIGTGAGWHAYAPVGDTTPSNVVAGVGAGAGTAFEAAHVDHVHGLKDRVVFLFGVPDLATSGILNAYRQQPLGVAGVTSIVIPRAGTLTAVGMSAQTARTGGICEMFTAINGSNLNLTCQLDGTHTQYPYATAAAGSSGNTFAAGDRLSILTWVTEATFDTYDSDAVLMVELTYD